MKAQAPTQPRYLLDGVSLCGIKPRPMAKLGEVASFLNVSTDVLLGMTEGANNCMFAHLKNALQTILKEKMNEQGVEITKEDVQNYIESLPEDRQSLPPLPLHAEERKRPLDDRSRVLRKEVEHDTNTLIAAIVNEMAPTKELLSVAVSEHGGDAAATVTFAKEAWPLWTGMASVCVVWYFYDNLAPAYNTAEVMLRDLAIKGISGKRGRVETDGSPSDKRARNAPQL